MSGPKYGQIIIGKIRRAKLMKELDRALEERDCKALKKKQSALQAQIDEFVGSHPMKFANDVLERAAAIAPESVLYKKLYSYVTEYEKLCKETCSMEGDSKQLLDGRTYSIERLFRMGNLADMIKHTSRRLEKSLENRASDLTYEAEGIVFLEDRELDALYDELIEELSDTSGFETARLAADEITNSAEYDNSYKKNLLKLRLEAARAEKASAAALRSERTVLSEKIESLRDFLGKEQTALPTDIRQLHYLAESLRAEAEQVTMGDYIGESLQDVLERLGYNIIGEDTLVTPKHETSKKFFEFSESSMLNVSTNEEGAVLFEVVGHSESGELTQAEKLSVKSDMDKFCPDYQQVKELLAEYDLTVTDERTCEADVRYVRAVKKDTIASARRGGKKKSRRMNTDE